MIKSSALHVYFHAPRGIPRDLQRSARARAVKETTTLNVVVRQALSEYAAGTWTPHPDAK